MSYYCCMFCPRHHKSEKQLSDRCDTCNRKYSFCLDFPPKVIDNYKIIRPLSRGFFGSVYIAEKEFLETLCVIKIIPKNVYEFFEKDFKAECLNHAKAAKDSEHIIKIVHPTEGVVAFSDKDNSKIDCYIAELQYVNGVLLKDFFEAKASIEMVAQVAIDLLKIHKEFSCKKLHHNDLHAENIIVETLPKETRRSDAICDSIKVMAIDLGSTDGISRSDIECGRLGDLRRIAEHINVMIDRVTGALEDTDDREYRIALALQEVVQLLIHDPEKMRDLEYDLLIEKIKETVYRASHLWAPWRKGLVLKNFSDHYNAQSLEPWDIPSLLVDPDGRWVRRISQPGPQIITGMRGCGKTHLLRSLEFHARAAELQGESSADILKRLSSDSFVGFFVSANKIVDLRSDSLSKIESKVTKIYIYYALQAVRGMLHLKDIDRNSVNTGAHKEIAECVAAHISEAQILENTLSLEGLERALERLAVEVAKPESSIISNHTPSDLFASLAVSIKRCSPIWSNVKVLFLLDDVSTRFLNLTRVGNVLTMLLFSHQDCAFKITSEWQTIELGLRSQGRLHPIMEGRDVDHFDLGADVLKMLKKKGKKFLCDILNYRSRYYISHPSFSPETLLGTVPLEDIAREIAQSRKTSAARKRVYRGIACLTHVCVGEIGDVVKLYEEILRCFKGDVPISDLDQSQCFQDMSSKRLFMLNRRNTKLRDCAKSFADASYSLMVQSYKENPKRIRQYNLIYVRISTSDSKEIQNQTEQLRELIDAGVFVYSGGAARTKTLHSEPDLQFKLSFRKLFGLANYIGLSDRDRFELSGKVLQQWLDHPDEGKEILLRNLGGVETIVDDEQYSQVEEIENINAEYATPALVQKSLFTHNPSPQQSGQTNIIGTAGFNFSIDRLPLNSLHDANISSVLTGLGFEERTLESNKLLAANVLPNQVYAFEYPLTGFKNEILNSWSGANVDVVNYSDEFLNNIDLGDRGLIDVSGLAKPVIFNSVRNQLLLYGEVFIGYGEASEYYPLQESIDGVLSAEKNIDSYQILDRVAALATGEETPYDPVLLLNNESDETRGRSLISFVSPKYQRLFSMLDFRDYDSLNLLYSNSSSPRARLAKISAGVISNTFQNVTISKTQTSDLEIAVGDLDKYYRHQYVHEGSNVELALTGSKIQAVAAAVLSVKRKVSKVWYVRPAAFSKESFSNGFKKMSVYRISI